MDKSNKLDELKQLSYLAKNIRREAFKAVYHAKSAHLGSAMSCVDILTALYFGTIQENEKFILSKGHACSALYATLAEKGILNRELFNTYMKEGSPLTAHCDTSVPGVHFSTGSVGMGLSVATGIAYADKIDSALDGNKRKTYALLSDGDLNEGSTWEAIMFAGHHKLDNLVTIIDNNNLQAYGKTDEVIQVNGPVYCKISDKFRAFNWGAKEIDGHSMKEITEAYKDVPFDKYKPSVIIAKTIKGKGISFLEGKIESHYLTPNEQHYQTAMEELK